MTKYLLPFIFYLTNLSICISVSYLYFFASIGPAFYIILISLTVLQSGIAYVFITQNIKVNKNLISDKDEIFKSVKEMTQDIKDVQSLNDNIEQELTLKFSSLYDKCTQNSKQAKTLPEKLEKTLWLICKELHFAQAILYLTKTENNINMLHMTCSYALLHEHIETIKDIEFGIGITGQAAANGSPMYIREVPKGYLKVVSGLGETYPDYIYITPVLDENQHTIALAEFSGFGSLSTEELKFTLEFVQKIISDIIFQKIK